MFLFELDDPKIGKYAVAIDSIKNDLDSGKISGEWSADQVLKYLEDYDIVDIDIDDLKKPPFNKVINKVEDDIVTWRGSGELSPEEMQNQSDKVVKQMADRAKK